MHSKAHKTRWTLLYVWSGVTRTYATQEACRSAAFECEGTCPVRVIQPIYADEV